MSHLYFIAVRSGRRNASGKRRGSILVLILVLVVLCSVAVTQFVIRGMGVISAEGYFVDQQRLRLQAWSGLETTLAVMADVLAVDGALYAPAQGWADPFAYAGVSLPEGLETRVSFTDLSGRLPLNSLDEGSLYLLFQQMGYLPDESLRLTNILLDWIDADDTPRIDGAESDVYGRRPFPHEAANRPMESLEELAYLALYEDLFFDEGGHPNELYHAFAEAVTVHPVTTLNINTASEMALLASGLFSETQVVALANFRAGLTSDVGIRAGRFFRNRAEAEAVLGSLPRGPGISLASSIWQVRLEVTEGYSTFVLEAVVATTPTSSGDSPVYPVQLIRVRENPRNTAPLSRSGDTSAI